MSYTNEGMMRGQLLAEKRAERAYIVTYTCGGSVMLNFAFWWPFDWVVWLFQGMLIALLVSFWITGHDYSKLAKALRRAWMQAYENGS